MSDNSAKQVNIAASLLRTVAVMLALGLVPGMPSELFLTFSVIDVALAWYSRCTEGQLVHEDEKSELDDESEAKVSSLWLMLKTHQKSR